MMAASIIGQAILLLVCLKLFAREEADLGFQKLVLVVCGILLCDAIILLACIEHFDTWVIYVVSAVTTTWIIKQFCWVTLNKALLVMLVFSAFNITMDYIQLRQTTRMNDAVLGLMTEDCDEMNKTFALLDDINEKIAAAERGERDMSGSETPVVPNENQRQVERGEQEVFIVESVLEPSTRESGQFTKGWSEAFSKVQVTAKGKGAKGYYVLANDTLLRLGKSIAVEHRGTTYEWRVKVIGKKDVVWEPVWSPEPEEVASLPDVPGS